MTLRIAATVLAVPTVLALTAGPAAAHQCVNASKPDPDKGNQVLIGPDDQVTWASPGVLNRIEQGLIDPETGEGFHGLLGIDFDGDGVADFQTYIVGPEGEIPLPAQHKGPACSGIVNVETYFTECVEF